MGTNHKRNPPMTLRSMTGYGSASKSTSNNHVSCEIRSLNSRYLEVNVKIPRSYISLESEISRLIAQYTHRGRIDVFIDLNAQLTTTNLPQLNERAVRHYSAMLGDMQRIFQESLGSTMTNFVYPSAGDFFKLEGVLESSNPQHSDIPEDQTASIMEAVTSALKVLCESRDLEGGKIGEALNHTLEELVSLREALGQVLPQARSSAMENYIRRVKQAAESLSQKEGTISEDRILLEVAIMAEKADIREEIERFDSHLLAMRDLIQSKGPAGRKLDFYCQELHREVNTLSSKFASTSCTHLVVDMKQRIEQLRQQVQNIE